MNGDPSSVPLRRGRDRSLFVVAVTLLVLAAVFPVETLVDAGASRYRTLASFRDDYLRGLQVFRIALATAGVVTAALPALWRRSRLEARPFGLPGRTDVAAAAVLYLATALAALPGLSQSFQDDEWRVVEQYARHGPGVILTRNAGDNQPLHSLLIWPFLRFLGVNEFAARLPVWLLGALSAPLLFLLLRFRGLARAPAWTTGLLLALSPVLLQYAHESRSYALLLPCILGLLMILPPLNEGDPRAWVGSVVLAAGAVGCHLFAAPAVAVIFLAPLARKRGRRADLLARRLSALLAAGALGFLLYAPVLPQMTPVVQEQAAWPVDYLRLDQLVAWLFVLPLPSAAALPFLLLLAIGIKRPAAPGMAEALGPSALLQVILCAATSSDIAPRYLTPSLAIAWVLIGDGLAALWPKVRLAWPTGLLTLALTVAADVGYYRIGNRDYRGLAREIDRRRVPGELVAGRYDARPLKYYLSPSVRIVSEGELQAAAPHWLVAVDVNLHWPPGFRAWIERDYAEELRMPSLRGALVAYRRKR